MMERQHGLVFVEDTLGFFALRLLAVSKRREAATEDFASAATSGLVTPTAD